MKRALVAGWFSFEGMGATAGDILARDLCRRWLTTAGLPSDIAVAAPFEGGVDWRTADPDEYSIVVFVCGPFGNGGPIPEFLARFGSSKLVGLDLSMLQDLDEWNPFDLLFERDSDRVARPDIVFLSKVARVPIVGVVLVHPQQEYEGGMHEQVNACIEDFLASRDVAAIRIDTRLDVNASGLRTASQVETLIAAADVVITTRLHGTVFAVKHAVPPIVIDPIRGGRKVLRHARAIGWPMAYAAEDISQQELDNAFDYCLTAAARADVRRVRELARRTISDLDDEFRASVTALMEKEV